jgi:hypothetical protein
MSIQTIYFQDCLLRVQRFHLSLLKSYSSSNVVTVLQTFAALGFAGMAAVSEKLKKEVEDETRISDGVKQPLVQMLHLYVECTKKLTHLDLMCVGHYTLRSPGNDFLCTSGVRAFKLLQQSRMVNIPLNTRPSKKKKRHSAT